MDFIYLDYNATTPLAESVIRVINETMKNSWGNPSSINPLGLKSKNIIEQSRAHVATMIRAEPANIIFTSGGTEASNMAIFSCIKYYKNKVTAPHVITSSVEHDATLKPLEHLYSEGMIDLSYVKPKPTGEITIKCILDLINERTCFISLMLANNETGVIFPISELGRCLEEINEAREKAGLFRILLHTDAAQAIGKIAVDVSELNVDYLTIAGHKFYGPKIGCLYVKNDAPVFPIFFGGGQENGFRPGTENTPLIAGLGEAARLVSENITDYFNHMINMRKMLEEELKAHFDPAEISINFSDIQQLSNTLCVSWTNRNARQLLQKCKQVISSTGSACHSSNLTTSRVLKECLHERLWAGTMRLSLGRETTAAQIKAAVEDLVYAFNETE